MRTMIAFLVTVIRNSEYVFTRHRVGYTNENCQITEISSS